jgi:hypothetical protein
MADPRVAVYIDFDNIVISRYDQLFGSGSWRKDNARDVAMNAKSSDAVAQRLDEARVDIGAILEYATSFGSVSVIRAYADWSAPANASYKLQLVDHSVDLTQLFNVSGTKNGADIRLAVDVIDDLFRFESISHVLVVAGDSDYIPLVTRCKRMGREVIGLGIDGSTSSAFKKACDRFTVYDDVPGITKPKTTTPRARATAKATTEAAPTVDAADPQAAASALLVRALQLIDDKNDEEWQTNGEVKTQMLRLDPSFKEKPLGLRSFTDFLESRSKEGVIEIKPKSKANDRRLKLP